MTPTETDARLRSVVRGFLLVAVEMGEAIEAGGFGSPGYGALEDQQRAALGEMFELTGLATRRTEED